MSSLSVTHRSGTHRIISPDRHSPDHLTGAALTGSSHRSGTHRIISPDWHSPDEGVADVADQVAEEGDDEDVDVADLAADGVRPPVGRHRGQSGHSHRQTCRQGGSASDLGTKL